MSAGALAKRLNDLIPRRIWVPVPFEWAAQAGTDSGPTPVYTAFSPDSETPDLVKGVLTYFPVRKGQNHITHSFHMRPHPELADVTLQYVVSQKITEVLIAVLDFKDDNA